MKEFLGKKTLIHITINQVDKYYEATILEITQTHITFKDKYDKIYTYRIIDVAEIKEFINKEKERQNDIL